MKKSYFIFVILISLLFSNLSIFSQQSILSDPLVPSKPMNRMKIGFLAGINYPSSPSELNSNPVKSTPKVQQSLLNGLDGLGFNATYDLGLMLRFQATKSLNIGSDISLTGWKSQISCNCSDSLWVSTNSLSMVGFGFLFQYFIYDNFFITPEISYNIFTVNSTENDKVRGNMDFTKIYSRIGAGLALGYEFPLSGKVSLDLFAKARVPNLLLKPSNSQTITSSPSIINSGTSSNEANITFISLNLGLAFSFYYLY